jgi:hypothetical protein
MVAAALTSVRGCSMGKWNRTFPKPLSDTQICGRLQINEVRTLVAGTFHEHPRRRGVTPHGKESTPEICFS